MAVEIQAIGPESDLLSSVIKLHGFARSTLGFLPRQVFAEQAGKGCLLVAVDSADQVRGYALFDLPRREIRLTHLCVDDAHRGEGIARALVEEICNRHPDRTGIRARCRRSWPANDMWPHLDFVPLSEAPGRSQAGYLLTTWWRDFGHPTLFSRLPSEIEPRVGAALDTDVFLDLFDEGRQGSVESQGLLADWISDQAELVVTRQVSQDLNHNQDANKRKLQLSRCSQFRQAGETTNGWRASLATLVEALDLPPKGEHNRSDLNHLARAHASGAQYFITRDDALRRAFGKTAASLGVRITSPGEFIAEMWSANDESYAPAQLQNTTFRMESLAGIDVHALAATFLSHGGERRKDLAKRIRDLISDTEYVDARIVTTAQSSQIALMVRRETATALEVPILRLAGQNQATVGRHIVQLQMSYARERSQRAVTVTDPFVSPSLEHALRDEGLQPVKGGWWGVTLPMSADRKTLAAALDAIQGVPNAFGLKKASSRLRQKPLSAPLADELERRFWPMKIQGATLPSFLVPIRSAFALELFDSGLSRDTMFPQSPLGIFREQVYYRSPQPSGGLEVPARLLWYVKRQPGVAGSGMIRACSYLFELSVDRPRTLYRRNSQLGVYKQAQVEAASRHGRAMALRFGLTELLRNPVSLNAARGVAARHGCDNLQLQSPWRLPTRMFEDIYERGTCVPE